MRGGFVAFEGGLRIARSSSRCCWVSLTGVSTTTRQSRSPMRPLRTDLTPLPRNAEHLAGLGFRRECDRCIAIERGHLQLGAKRGLGEADRHFAMQIVAVALEDRVFAHVDFDI